MAALALGISAATATGKVGTHPQMYAVTMKPNDPKCVDDDDDDDDDIHPTNLSCGARDLVSPSSSYYAASEDYRTPLGGGANSTLA